MWARMRFFFNSSKFCSTTGCPVIIVLEYEMPISAIAILLIRECQLFSLGDGLICLIQNLVVLVPGQVRVGCIQDLVT